MKRGQDDDHRAAAKPATLGSGRAGISHAPHDDVAEQALRPDDQDEQQDASAVGSRELGRKST